MNLIEECREIVKNRAYQEFEYEGYEDGVVVDMQTANVIITIYEAVNSENKEKLESLDVLTLADVCWTMYGKCKI